MSRFGQSGKADFLLWQQCRLGLSCSHGSAGAQSAPSTGHGDEYTYKDLPFRIAVPEGMTGYLNDENVRGDNRDTSHLMTDDFTLDNLAEINCHNTRQSKSL